MVSSILAYKASGNRVIMKVCKYETHQCPRNQGCCSLSRCGQWRTRHRPSNVPVRQTWTWVMWAPLHCIGSSAPAFVANVEAVTIEPSSADEPQSTEQKLNTSKGKQKTF